MTDTRANQPSPAGYDVRLVAHIVDSVAVFVFCVGGILAGAAIMGMMESALAAVGALLAVLAAYCAHPIYYILMPDASGATMGKRYMGLAVVRMSGDPVTRKTMAKRYLGYLVSAATFGLGHLAVFVTGNRRAVQDFVADTVVVQAVPLDPRKRQAWTWGAAVFMVCVLIVSAVAMRAFDQLMGVAAEAATKGNLNSLNSAISIYYGDHEGAYPDSLSTDPASPFSRYLEAVPAVKATHAGIGAGRKESPSGTQVLCTTDEVITVKGRGWRYNPNTGRVFVNSCATDSHGVPYSCYGY